MAREEHNEAMEAIAAFKDAHPEWETAPYAPALDRLEHVAWTVASVAFLRRSLDELADLIK